MSDHYRQLGLEAGETVYNFLPGFNLDEVKAALFGSTYSSPQTLEVKLGEGSPTLRVVVASVTAFYLPHAAHVGDSPVGVHHDEPNYRIEGWLTKSGFDPYNEVVRVRIVLDWDGREFEGRFQRIPENPDPNGEFKDIDVG